MVFTYKYTTIYIFPLNHFYKKNLFCWFCFQFHKKESGVMQALESLTDSQVRYEITWEIAKLANTPTLDQQLGNTKRIYTLRIIIFKN